MKTNIQAALLGAFATAAVFTTIPAILPRDVTAQEPAKAVVVSGAEQYRIVSLNAINSEASTLKMEEFLNRLAADGWRVRTGVGTALVLAK